MFDCMGGPPTTPALAKRIKTWTPSVTITPIVHDFPTLDDIERMRSREWPVQCPSCSEFVPKNISERVVRSGICWHRSPSCFKCSACAKPFDIASGDHVWGPRPPPFALIVDLSAYCTGCWMERYADTCDTCEGKLDLNGNCETCITAARIAAADPCFICKEPMCYIEGRFSGRTIDCNGGNVIHRECEQAYREFVAPKCFFCSGPLCQVPNRFSGKKKK